MGFISSAIDEALMSVGNSMFEAGENMLKGGFEMWKSCSSVTMAYAVKSPMSQTNAWNTVTGNIYQISLAIGASLAVLFFVLGWLRESLDIKNSFQLENMFRFFIRYAITASLLVNSLSLVKGITQCTTAVVNTMHVDVASEEVEGIFDGIKEKLKEDKDSDGGTYLAAGFEAMAGGMIGGLVIIICGISLVLSVLSRLFKMLLCIPFAPVAFSGFAGGGEFSQMGVAWMKTFIGYALEAVVIALSISISFGLFRDASLFQSPAEAGDMASLILQICEYCMPMITACACVKGAEMTVRRCLGLG